MALLALANLMLVLFDLSYIPWRDFWLRGRFQIPLLNTPVQLPVPPQLTQWYDPVKGIEPNRETQEYLTTVEELKQVVNQKGLRSAEAEKALATLRQLSNEMIATNPFALANKSGTLEKIKNRMRDRIYPKQRARASAREAFNQFWSVEYLTENYQEKINWFDQQVGDLIRTNYFRSISESGDFTNNFGAMDAPFVLLFTVEFLARTFYLGRRYTGVSWLDAMVWRWYDVLLFFPFGVVFSGWAWLRLIPTTIRLHQAKLVNLKRLRDDVVESFVGSIANELTEVVLIQLVDQVQAAIQRGDLVRVLAATGSSRMDINDVDELAELTDLFLKMTVQKVLPEIQPELQAFVSQSVDVTLSQSTVYRRLKNLPGIGNLPGQVGDRLSHDLLNGINQTLAVVLDDPRVRERLKDLIQNIGQAYSIGLKEKAISQDVQTLLVDLLEEIKLSYVQQSETIPPEVLLEEARQLRQARS